MVDCQTLQGLMFDINTTDMTQIFQSLSYKEYPIVSSKFTTFGLFILVLGTSAIMDQPACCYAVMTSEIVLYSYCI